MVLSNAVNFGTVAELRCKADRKIEPQKCWIEMLNRNAESKILAQKPGEFQRFVGQQF